MNWLHPSLVHLGLTPHVLLVCLTSTPTTPLPPPGSLLTLISDSPMSKSSIYHLNSAFPVNSFYTAPPAPPSLKGTPSANHKHMRAARSHHSKRIQRRYLGGGRSDLQHRHVYHISTYHTHTYHILHTYTHRHTHT